MLAKQIAMWEKEAWKLLEKSTIYYQGRPIGTKAAQDPEMKSLNYDQCFIRNFVPCALVFPGRTHLNIVHKYYKKDKGSNRG